VYVYPGPNDGPRSVLRMPTSYSIEPKGQKAVLHDFLGFLHVFLAGQVADRG
jgi:hypothetical protein